jgi:hypothetical protein
MILWSSTQILMSTSRDVLSTALSSIQEGMPAVSAIENSQMKVTFSSGATSGLAGKCVGIFMSPRRTFATNTSSVTITTPVGGGTLLLPVTVLSNIVGVFVASTGTLLTSSTSAAGTTNIQVSTDATTGLTALTFDSTNYGLGAGVVLNVFYNYAMSPAVEVSLYGNTSPGFFASDMLSSVGIIKLGRVSVNNFSPSANWYSGVNAPNPKGIAGGLFTDSGNAAAGFIATNIYIRNFPTPANPWLDLEFTA